MYVMDCASSERSYLSYFVVQWRWWKFAAVICPNVGFPLLKPSRRQQTVTLWGQGVSFSRGWVGEGYMYFVLDAPSVVQGMHVPLFV